MINRATGGQVADDQEKSAETKQGHHVKNRSQPPKVGENASKDGAAADAAEDGHINDPHVAALLSRRSKKTGISHGHGHNHSGADPLEKANQYQMVDSGGVGNEQADNAVDKQPGNEKSFSSPTVGKVPDQRLQQATAEGEGSGDQAQGESGGPKGGGQDREHGNDDANSEQGDKDRKHHGKENTIGHGVLENRSPGRGAERGDREGGFSV